jgi:hypothetical protein
MPVAAGGNLSKVIIIITFECWCCQLFLFVGLEIRQVTVRLFFHSNE